MKGNGRIKQIGIKNFKIQKIKFFKNKNYILS